MTKIKRTNVKRRYDRIAWIYDFMEGPMEAFMASRWREALARAVRGEEVLEVGVGTGKNIPYYQRRISYTAVDISPKMLKRAVYKSKKAGKDVDFALMDIQDLAFRDSTFDTIFASFVFCSVPDPVKGLKELKRVCKPDGRLILIEHVRPPGNVPGIFFDILNPLVVRLVGANINRKTVFNVKKAGWNIINLKLLASQIVWWIEAAPS